MADDTTEPASDPTPPDTAVDVELEIDPEDPQQVIEEINEAADVPGGVRP